MRFYILFFVLLIISCSETINWDVELNECSFEFLVEDKDFFVSSDEMVKQYLFLKNLDNSAKTYNFILEQSEKVFSGEVVSGRYIAVYYFLVSKTVSGKKKFYTQAYFVDTFLLSENNKNQKNIVPATIKNPFRAVRCDEDKVIITKDLSYDLFQIYKISALSMNVNKKVKSYDYSDDENFYFESDEAYASVIKACNDVGEHFPLTQKALIKALKNEGISICSKGECTRNVRVFGTPKRLICISKETFNKNLPPEEETICDDEELPFGPGEIIFEEKSGF